MGGAHVFTIVLIACAVLGTALSNDYFADQATVGCTNNRIDKIERYTNAFPVHTDKETITGSLGDLVSSGGVYDISFKSNEYDGIDHKCQKNSIKTVHDNMWFLVWTYCVF